MINATHGTDTLQQQLQHLHDWAEGSNMHYNGDKLELMTYGKTEAKPLYRTPAGTLIKQKNSIRDLGVLMSSNTKFDTHIKNSCSRASNSQVGTKNIQNKSPTTNAYIAKNSCCKPNGILQLSLESNGH